LVKKLNVDKANTVLVNTINKRVNHELASIVMVEGINTQTKETFEKVRKDIFDLDNKLRNTSQTSNDKTITNKKKLEEL